MSVARRAGLECCWWSETHSGCSGQRVRSCPRGCAVVRDLMALPIGAGHDGGVLLRTAALHEEGCLHAPVAQPVQQTVGIGAGAVVKGEGDQLAAVTAFAWMGAAGCRPGESVPQKASKTVSFRAPNYRESVDSVRFQNNL
jgi:hypothetical protein